MSSVESKTSKGKPHTGRKFVPINLSTKTGCEKFLELQDMFLMNLPVDHQGREELVGIMTRLCLVATNIWESSPMDHMSLFLQSKEDFDREMVNFTRAMNKSG